MRYTVEWHAYIRNAFPAAVPDEDVIDELAQHATLEYDAARAQGCDDVDARRRVDEQLREWVQDASLLLRPARRPTAPAPPSSTGPRLSGVLQDLRYAARLLRRQPGYAAVVIATMALGIAATTVLGSVAYGVLLKPLPWADAPRLVRLYETRQGSTNRFRPMMTNVSYLAWRDPAAHTLDAIGAWRSDPMTVTDGTAAERITVASTTPGLFSILLARPELGRAFEAGEEEPGRPKIILLSHALWLQRFGGRGDIVGRTIRLDATTYSIVGVMPAGFAFPDRDTRAWIPFYIPPPTTPGQRGHRLSLFQAMGRLRAGATPQQAATEGTTRGRAVPPVGVVAMAVFGSNGPVEISAVPMLEALTGDVKPAIVILLAAVALLLVTAVANVTSLQLARSTSRRRELAVRAALGAWRGRLVRQTLVENLLLGLLGGAVGLLLAAMMHRALPALLPADFPRLDDLSFDLRVQLFAIAVSIAAGLGCGLLPAFQIARANLVPALVEDALAPVGGRLRSGMARARAVIMTAQVAIACVLLIGALLLVRSFLVMMRADTGYDFTNVLSARVVLPDGEYSSERRLQTLDRILDRLRAMPGVSRVGYTTALPFSGGEMLSSFPLKTRDGSHVQVQTGVKFVSAGYFAAVGQRVVEGREFGPEETRTAQPAIIVNREFARKYLEGRALNWTTPGAEGTPPRIIVGVVEDAARRAITDSPQPEMYAPAAQQTLNESDINLIARTTGDPETLVPALRQIVREAAPLAPVESIMTMEDRVAATLTRPRLYAVLLTTFAGFALAIAGVGLFGVLSYSVAQRSREIGVRSALGAPTRHIVGLVLGQSMVISGVGLAVGLIASFWLTRFLQKFLYGLTPHDAVTFGEVALLLFAVAAVASYIPARRAARVDPVKALRG